MDGNLRFPSAVTHEAEGVTIKSPRELALMRRASQVVARTIGVLLEAIQPGVVTRELDAIAREQIESQGARPSFLGYRGFPATICVSLNEEVVHGIPGDRVLQEGDLVKLDVGAIVEGFHGDSAVTVGVGTISAEKAELQRVTRSALEAGIRAARPGARVGDIGTAIQGCVEAQGTYGLVREYVGHGIGRRLHEEPSVPNYGQPGRGPLLRPGMTLAIEPMVNLGTWRTRALEDGWTVVTADGAPSAHYEHTIVVTDGEAEILTQRRDESVS